MVEEPKNPYPETIIDEASGIQVPNELHRAWGEGNQLRKAAEAEGRMQEVKLHCRKCGHEFTEYVDLPMEIKAFIARARGWCLCPECGANEVDMVGGVFMVPDKITQ